MTLQYSEYKSSKSKKCKCKNKYTAGMGANGSFTAGARSDKIAEFRQVEITIRKNGVIRIELIPSTP